MLPKKQRLTSAEVSMVLSKGSVHRSPLFLVRAAPADAFSCSVIVSKKVAKTAVLRNSLRRKIYNLVRELRSHQQLPHKKYCITLKTALIPNQETLISELKTVLA